MVLYGTPAGGGGGVVPLNSFSLHVYKINSAALALV